MFNTPFKYQTNFVKKINQIIRNDIDKDKISGVICIGTKTEEPSERRRPDANNVITYL